MCECVHKCTHSFWVPFLLLFVVSGISVWFTSRVLERRKMYRLRRMNDLLTLIHIFILPYCQFAKNRFIPFVFVQNPTFEVFRCYVASTVVLADPFSLTRFVSNLAQCWDQAVIVQYQYPKNIRCVSRFCLFQSES